MTESMESTLAQHVRSAAARPDVRDAVGRVYTDLQREIDARRPICSASGRCCRFEESGHRLYVSTLELAAFVGGLGERQQPVEAWDGTGCPLQVAKLCSVHAIRPFGCRMFFCDATSTAWQNERYEQFHAELKRLHESLDVPYFYVEWRQALVTLGLAPSLSSEGASSERRRGLSLPQL
jgi:Fe-S-cluster containining protein